MGFAESHRFTWEAVKLNGRELLYRNIQDKPDQSVIIFTTIIHPSAYRMQREQYPILFPSLNMSSFNTNQAKEDFIVYFKDKN